MNEKGVNKVTLIRIILAIIIAVIIIFPLDTLGITMPKFLINEVYVDSTYLTAGLLFLVAIMTNFYDGSFTKKKKLSEEDLLFSATADKLLINSALIGLTAHGFIHPIITVIIIFRDILVNMMKTFIKSKSKDIEVVKISKYKTICLMLGIIFTLFYNMPFELFGVNIAGYLLILGSVLSIASLIQYYNYSKKIK